jgi:hypothetical protein
MVTMEYQAAWMRSVRRTPRSTRGVSRPSSHWFRFASLLAVAVETASRSLRCLGGSAERCAAGNCEMAACGPVLSSGHIGDVICATCSKRREIRQLAKSVNVIDALIIAGRLSVVAFSSSASKALLALQDGDSAAIAAIAGEMKLGIYTDKAGQAKPSVDLIAHARADRVTSRASARLSRRHHRPTPPTTSMTRSRLTEPHHPPTEVLTNEPIQPVKSRTTRRHPPAR